MFFNPSHGTGRRLCAAGGFILLGYSFWLIFCSLLAIFDGRVPGWKLISHLLRSDWLVLSFLLPSPFYVGFVICGTVGLIWFFVRQYNLFAGLCLAVFFGGMVNSPLTGMLAMSMGR